MQVRPVLQQVERRAREVRTPGAPFAGVRRLVVVRDDRLGDLVHSLPPVDEMRDDYPAAELTLMVAPGLAPLAERVVGVDRVLEASPDKDGLRDQLAKLDPELLVCISRSARVALAAARAGVRHRVGPGRRFFAPLFHRRVDEPRRSGPRHELEYALSFAHRAGAGPVEARFPLRIGPELERSARGWLEERGVEPPCVVLHPGSGGSCPRWPAGHFLSLAGLLVGQGIRPVLTLGPADDEARLQLAAADEPVRALPNFRGELPALAALLARADLIVSNSTGPLHLAVALGTPALAIHAPWASCGVGRWGPYHAEGWGIVVEHPEANEWSRAERRRRAAGLMEALAPEQVLAAARKLLGGQAPRQ